MTTNEVPNPTSLSAFLTVAEATLDTYGLKAATEFITRFASHAAANLDSDTTVNLIADTIASMGDVRSALMTYGALMDIFSE